MVFLYRQLYKGNLTVLLHNFVGGRKCSCTPDGQLCSGRDCDNYKPLVAAKVQYRYV